MLISIFVLQKRREIGSVFEPGGGGLGLGLEVAGSKSEFPKMERAMHKRTIDEAQL